MLLIFQSTHENWSKTFYWFFNYKLFVRGAELIKIRILGTGRENWLKIGPNYKDGK